MSEKVKIEFFDNIDQKPSETLKTDENLSLKCPEVNNNKNNTFKLIDNIIFRVGFVCNVCVRLCNAKRLCNVKNIFAKRKIFWLSFKNDEKTQIFRIFTNNFFFRDIFSSCFHWSMTHVWMTGCEAKAFLNKPDWIQPNLIWKLERRSSLSLELITKRRKLKKGGKKEKEGKKGEKKKEKRGRQFWF